MRAVWCFGVAEPAWPAEGRWRALFEVPFERSLGRDKLRSQAEERLTPDLHGSGHERKQPSPSLPSVANSGWMYFLLLSRTPVRLGVECLDHSGWMPRRAAQQPKRGAFRRATPLLPVAKGCHADSDQGRELRLRLAQFGACGLHIGRFESRRARWPECAAANAPCLADAFHELIECCVLHRNFSCLQKINLSRVCYFSIPCRAQPSFWHSGVLSFPKRSSTITAGSLKTPASESASTRAH